MHFPQKGFRKLKELIKIKNQFSLFISWRYPYTNLFSIFYLYILLFFQLFSDEATVIKERPFEEEEIKCEIWKNVAFVTPLIENHKYNNKAVKLT